MKMILYRGFTVAPVKVYDGMTYRVYANDKYVNSCDWVAQSLLEAYDFIDSQYTEHPVTRDNFVSYSIAGGFQIKEE